MRSAVDSTLLCVLIRLRFLPLYVDSPQFVYVLLFIRYILLRLRSFILRYYVLRVRSHVYGTLPLRLLPFTTRVYICYPRSRLFYARSRTFVIHIHTILIYVPVYFTRIRLRLRFPFCCVAVVVVTFDYCQFYTI